MIKKASLKIGFLLGRRHIQRANIWTSVLVIFIMTITFLNLVVISGILVGLIEGSIKANREQYTGNIFISTLPGEEYIEKSGDVISRIQNISSIEEYSPRIIENGSIEANYRTRRDPDVLPDTAGGQFTGIDITKEEKVTSLSRYVVEGEYLKEGEFGYILIGANLLERYSAGFGDGFSSLENVYPGSRLMVTIGGAKKEMIVKGIIKSKVGETSLRVFMNQNELRTFAGRTNANMNEIAIKTKEGVSEEFVKSQFIKLGIEKYAKVRTSREAVGSFLEDIAKTFGILGNIIGLIALLVSSITIFIIIFINAVTKRRFIGIMKAMGISPFAIEFSYILQALFYGVCGTLIGLVLIYFVIEPIIAKNPIDFPFSDGILSVPLPSVLFKMGLLYVATLLAGFIPARMIIKKNTLSAILGR
ncbi:MAG: putative ABC transport system permease protein [Flavobacteriaceae bacterium]|jgi:putative ABC transport system permease protein